MMKNSKLKFREYMQNISSVKSFGKFVLIVDKSQLGVDFYLKIRSRILFFFFLYRILNDPSKILEKKVLQKLQVPKNVYI